MYFVCVCRLPQIYTENARRLTAGRPPRRRKLPEYLRSPSKPSEYTQVRSIYSSSSPPSPPLKRQDSSAFGKSSPALTHYVILTCKRRLGAHPIRFSGSLREGLHSAFNEPVFDFAFQSAVNVERHSTLDRPNVQEEFPVRRQEQVSLDHEWRRARIQSPLWIRRPGRRCHGGVG